MTNKTLKALLISDFNLDFFNGLLNNDEGAPVISSKVALYGPVIPTLINQDLSCWQEKYDFAVVWSRPESVIEGFNTIMNFQKVSSKSVLSEVDEYTNQLLMMSNRMKSIFVPSWTMPAYYKGYGLLDMRQDIGIANMLMRMNLRLAQNFEDAKNIFILNAQKWVEDIGRNATNPKLWYLSKSAFSSELYKNALKDIKGALNGIEGNARKLIVVDLDDTLWGGIVGDEGWQNIRLGGHDAVGEAFVDFQQSLKSFKNRGLLLGIVSKNDEANALEAINRHKEMVLKQTDFSGWKINWEDKAKNIIDLVSELNLGLQSVVFIDDNPVERARVRDALPEVFVPEWPEDKLLYKKALLELSCFNVPFLTTEDSNRGTYYSDEKTRNEMKINLQSLDDWLKMLDIKVEVEQLNDTNLQRAAQLLNKTNQMNLTTRRMGEKELLDWAEKENRKFWVVRVSDKFGDSGITGLISVQRDGKKAHIVDYVLSCRVIGRKIEDVMVYIAYNYANSLNMESLEAHYIPTKKNNPCLEFFKTANFSYDEKMNIFTMKIKSGCQLPDIINVKGEICPLEPISW